MRGRARVRVWPWAVALVLVAAAPSVAVPQLVSASDAHPGWTVRADDQDPGHPVVGVDDGDPTTFWTTTSTAFPHTLTLDTGAVGPLAGVTLTPRQDGHPDGNIGQFRIQTSTNGRWWTTAASGQLADTSGEKSVEFAMRQARYLRLTALSEAGHRASTTSLAELSLLTTAPAKPAPGTGRWSLPINLPLVPVSGAALSTGKVLLWSSYQPDSYGYVGQPEDNPGRTLTTTFDPATATVTQHLVTETQHDMFCPGTALLPDGTLLVNGGSSDQKTSLYDPVSGTWSATTPMVIKRGYQSAVTTSTGQVFTLGGSWNDKAGGKDGELFTVDAKGNTSTLLPGALVAPILTHDSEGVFRQDNHPWLFAWSDGTVFHAGPSVAMHWYDTRGKGSVSAAGDRTGDADAMNGSASMYDIGKILTVGGSPDYNNSIATTNAHTIDITTSPPTVKTVSPMASARAFATSVVLPDGTVLVVGGQAYAHPFSDATAVLSPELFNPATGTFTTMAPMQVPRDYHSIALLLPDARVLAAGGGLCGTACPVDGNNHPDAEIYTPPYLLSSTGAPLARPTITKAPTTASAGRTMSVTTAKAVSRFALVRMASVTHAVNNDQRRVPLTIKGPPAASRTGVTYAVALPGDDGVLIPGEYMLFALDARGVPSIAKIVQVS